MDYFVVVYINGCEVKRSPNALSRAEAKKTKSIMDGLNLYNHKVKIFHRDNLPKEDE